MGSLSGGNGPGRGGRLNGIAGRAAAPPLRDGGEGWAVAPSSVRRGLVLPFWLAHHAHEWGVSVRGMGDGRTRLSLTADGAAPHVVLWGGTFRQEGDGFPLRGVHVCKGASRTTLP